MESKKGERKRKGEKKKRRKKREEKEKKNSCIVALTWLRRVQFWEILKLLDKNHATSDENTHYETAYYNYDFERKYIMSD